MSNAKSEKTTIALHLSPEPAALTHRGAVGDDNRVKNLISVHPALLHGRARHGDQLRFTIALDTSDTIHNGILETPVGHNIAGVIAIGSIAKRYNLTFDGCALKLTRPDEPVVVDIVCTLIADPLSLPENATEQEDSDPDATEAE